MKPAETTVSTSKPPHLRYRPDIDGLRAIAVLSVVIFHAFPGRIKGGFIGVDVFFVISGYLISLIIFEGLASRTLRLSDFYARRIKRIFPALLLVLVSSYAFGWIALLSNEYKELGKHIAAGAGFVSNLVLWSEAGYFDNSAHTKPLLHLWSLGIEEQFYILWPIAIWIAWRRNSSILAITAITFFISFSLNIRDAERDSVSAFYFPHTRFWELLSGSLLAWIIFKNRTGLQTQKFGFLAQTRETRHIKQDNNYLNFTPNLLSTAGCAVLGSGFLFITEEVSFPGAWAAIPVFGTALIILAGPSAWINRTILSNRIAVWFGLISFPLYLWHWPLLSFARIVEGSAPQRSIRIFAVLLSIALAWLTYRYIERPLRLGKTGKATVPLLLSLIVIVGLTGFVTYERDGLKFRNKELGEVAEIFSTPFPKISHINCNSKTEEISHFTFNDGCRLSKDTHPKIMFIGDSHTAHYRNGVWSEFPNDAVLMVVQTGCLPFTNDKKLKGDCRKKHDALLSYIEKNTSAETVVLSGYWASLISGGFHRQDEHWRIPKTPNIDDIDSFKANASEFIRRVLATGKKIILFMDTPDLRFNIKDCFEFRPLRSSIKRPVTECWIDEAEFNQRTDIYDKVIHEILKNYPEVKLFNPRKHLCKNEKCAVSDGRIPYYSDGDHLNHHGAKFIMKEFRNEYF